MAKELTRKQIAELGSEQVAEYYNNMLAETRAKKKKAEKILKEIQSIEKQKNRKRRNHALFLLAGEVIKDKEYASELIKKMMETASERNKADLQILLDEVKST